MKEKLKRKWKTKSYYWKEEKMWNNEIKKIILWLIIFGSWTNESACEKKYTK